MIGDFANLPGDFANLPVEERFTRRGITAEQYAMLRELDPRIVAYRPTSTTAAVDRIARWLHAGQPTADLARLVFEGHDSVRSLVEECIARVPPPIAWHGIEFVEWIEVGRDYDGSMCVIRPARAPAGDSAHQIKICGVRTDERIREVLPHELAHSLHATVCKVEPARGTMRRVERDARTLMLGRNLGIEKPEILLAEWRSDEELLAEATAAAWGFERPPLYHERSMRRLGFIAELNDAAELLKSSRPMSVAPLGVLPPPGEIIQDPRVRSPQGAKP